MADLSNIASLDVAKDSIYLGIVHRSVEKILNQIAGLKGCELYFVLPGNEEFISNIVNELKKLGLSISREKDCITVTIN